MCVQVRLQAVLRKIVCRSVAYRYVTFGASVSQHSGLCGLMSLVLGCSKNHLGDKHVKIILGCTIGSF